jgi:hypothetical protein
MSIYSNEQIFGTAIIFALPAPPPPTFCVFDFSCDTEQEAGDNRMNWVTIEQELGVNLRSLRQWVRSLFFWVLVLFLLGDFVFIFKPFIIFLLPSTRNQ